MMTEFGWCRFDWGLRVQRLSERVLNLLEDEQLIQEERAKARKVTREIKGYGSFSNRQCSIDAKAKADIASVLNTTYGRWNSHCYGYENDFQRSNVFQEVSHVDSRDNQHQEKVKFIINHREECSNDGMDHPFINDQLQGAKSLLFKKII